MLFNVTHSGGLHLRELDMAARVINEVVDPTANIIFGTVVDPTVGDEILMTVIATGFAQQSDNTPIISEETTVVDFALPGISSPEDAELPAFLRRNVRSLDVMNTVSTD